MGTRKKASIKDLSRKSVNTKKAAKVKGGQLPGKARHTWPAGKSSPIL